MNDSQSSLEIQIATERRIPAEAVRALYDLSRWWPERTLANIGEVIAGGLALGAWKNGTLIGFVRAVSDGRFRAYVEDVVVHPDHRRSGVASKLLDELMKELTDIDVVSLFCSDDNCSLYEKAGFNRTSQVVMHRASA